MMKYINLNNDTSLPDSANPFEVPESNFSSCDFSLSLSENDSNTKTVKMLTDTAGGTHNPLFFSHSLETTQPTAGNSQHYHVQTQL